MTKRQRPEISHNNRQRLSYGDKKKRCLNVLSGTQFVPKPFGFSRDFKSDYPFGGKLRFFVQLCSVICVHSFGGFAKAVGLRLFLTSLQSQKMSYEKCSIDIFVDLKPFGCYLRLRPSALGFMGGVVGRGKAHSIPRLRVPISSLLTHMIYLVLFVSYLAGSKSISASLTRMR